MTAVPQDDVLTPRRRASVPGWLSRLPRVEKAANPKPPSTLIFIWSWSMTMLAIVLFTLLANITVISQLQHFSAQHKLYGELRYALAEGSAPIGQLDVYGHLVTPGTPLALLKIPEIGVNEVVVDGTASEQTKIGVGHRPDTPLPGQPGDSILMGRAAAYGGVFGDLDKLKLGQTFKVTTGQGTSTYRVSYVGSAVKVKLPELVGNAGRLTMFTAGGSAFLPHGLVEVDADLISTPFGRPTVAFAQGVFSESDKPLAGDPSRMFSLSWLLELLVILVVAAVWAWKRWSQPAMWIVFVPVLAAVGLACADRVCDLLPNLM